MVFLYKNAGLADWQTGVPGAVTLIIQCSV